MSGKYTVEQLVHYQCEICNKWWSIGDAPIKRKEWFCPWCSHKQTVEEITESKEGI